MSAFNTIEFRIEDGLAILTLNRPDKLNSFNNEMFSELRQALKNVNKENGVRCLLITGAGRGFCAGQDLADRAVSPGDEAPDLGASLRNNYNPMMRTLKALEMPILCAVNGVAAGAGASLALSCDIVFAAKSASFIQAFCKIGVIPDSGGTWTLPRLVGRARAMGLALTGDKISAEKAEEWGMIWKAVDNEALMDTAVEMGKYLATQPTKGLSLIKQALNEAATNTFEEQLDLEVDLQTIAGSTSDYQEGVAAFMAKRQPNFTGE